MKSSPSNSPTSARRFGRFDPIAIILPILLGILRAAPFAAPFAMFLGPDFGISQGREAPWVWALAIIGALGFWSARFIPRYVRGQAASSVLFVLIGIAAWAVWMIWTPNWNFLEQERVTSIVGDNFRFAWMLVITLAFWFSTLKLALDEREQSAEGVRGIMQRALIWLVVGVVLAATIGGEMGDAGLRAAFFALPAALVSGVGAVAMSELASTRALARRRGAAVPGWDRWARIFLGSSVILLVLTFVAALVFGPGFIQLVIDTLRTIWGGIATVILWVMYGFVYVLVWIARVIAWIFNSLFGMDMEVPAPPAAPLAGTPEPMPQEELPEGEPWKYADAFKFGLLFFAILIGTLILMRFARFRQSDAATDTDEERSSVFSGKLLRDQLRNLFRRKGHSDPPRRLDLGSDPASVREAMLYLQVLAERLGIGRRPHETPHDFSARLEAAWPNVRQPVAEFIDLYENVRYGETERDRAQAVSLWRQIWQDRREMPGATGQRPT